MNVEDYSKARTKRQLQTEPDVIFTRKPYVSQKSKRLAN